MNEPMTTSDVQLVKITLACINQGGHSYSFRDNDGEYLILRGERPVCIYRNRDNLIAFVVGMAEGYSKGMEKGRC
jgi:hypothetical protein